MKIYICFLNILTFFSIINNSPINFSFYLTIIRVTHDFKIKFDRKTESLNCYLNCNLSDNNIKHVLFCLCTNYISIMWTIYVICPSDLLTYIIVYLNMLLINFINDLYNINKFCGHSCCKYFLCRPYSFLFSKLTTGFRFLHSKACLSFAF